MLNGTVKVDGLSCAWLDDESLYSSRGTKGLAIILSGLLKSFLNIKLFSSWPQELQRKDQHPAGDKVCEQLTAARLFIQMQKTIYTLTSFIIPGCKNLITLSRDHTLWCLSK